MKDIVEFPGDVMDDWEDRGRQRRQQISSEEIAVGEDDHAQDLVAEFKERLFFVMFARSLREPVMATGIVFAQSTPR